MRDHTSFGCGRSFGYRRGGGVVAAVVAAVAVAAGAAGPADAGPLAGPGLRGGAVLPAASAGGSGDRPRLEAGQISGLLEGVAAVSAGSAWAVGSTNSNRPLILHWNGATWHRAASPALSYGFLHAVAADSARSAWAVGSLPGRALILRWNGRTWRQVHGPSLARDPVLAGVAAASGHRAWAVGNFTYGGEGAAFILNWNGTAWKRTAIPAGVRELNAVTATSDRNAWAVGETRAGPVILRWKGITSLCWRRSG